jgi:dihydrofolate reductase
MNRFDIVVAADATWGIGKSNGLPWPKLKADLQHFRKITSEASEGAQNAIVMGRKTWQSAEVQGRPLPRRINCVISRAALQVPPGVVATHSLHDAIVAVAAQVESIFVVGGAEIYRLALTMPELRYIYLTRVNGDFGCDVHIPNLDQHFVVAPWQGSAAHAESGVDYTIERLIRRD